MPRIQPTPDLTIVFGQFAKRLGRLERSDGLGHSATQGGTTRWQDTSGADQVVVGLLDDATYGIQTVKWIATTSTTGTDMVLTGGLTTDHAVVGQAGAGGSGLTVGPSGTRLTQVRKYTTSLTPASVPANSTSEQSFTVTGLSTNDLVWLNGPAPTAGVVPVHTRVSAADTIRIVFANVTAGALTPASGTYLVLAIRS